MAQYREKLGMSAEPVEEEKIQTQSVKGAIDFLATAEEDGNTYFYFTIQGDSYHLYRSSIKNNSRQVLLKTGTTVTVEYISTTEDGIQEVTKINF